MKTLEKFGILILFMVSGIMIYAQKDSTKCGIWRWDVKTLTDQDGADLLSKTPTPSSIGELVKEKPPKVLFATEQTDGKISRYPSENQVVEIIAYVTEVMDEIDNSAIHFVLKSPNSGKTMVGEIPDPACPKFDKFPQLKDHFTKTRQDGNTIWNMLNKTKKPVKVKITGVPFWDGILPQRLAGASKYFREIHPILTIVPE